MLDTFFQLTGVTVILPLSETETLKFMADSILLVADKAVSAYVE